VGTPWRRVVLLVLLATIASVMFAGRVQRKMRDFEVYWTAGARVAKAEPLYRVEDGHYRFKYLPAFAVVVSPLARLPIDQAKAVWYGLSVACLLGFVALAVGSVPSPALRRSVVAVLAAVAMAKFLAHELVLGQANLLFGLVCAAALAALLRQRDALAGAGFGLATIVKPYAIVFVPYLLLTRRWTAAAAACVTAAAVLLLPVPAFGLQGTWRLMGEWWHTASETSAPLLTNADSSSVFAMYAKWLGWGATAAAMSVATLLALGAMFVVILARRQRATAPELLEVGLLLTFIPLSTPQGWDYVLLLSTPLVALLIARAPDMPPLDRRLTVGVLLVIAFSLYDLMGRAAYAAFMTLSVITVCYLILTVIALRLRLRLAA
jgi:alpha-1,2-mannosyltransferase